jgi:hypothetical protein
MKKALLLMIVALMLSSAVHACPDCPPPYRYGYIGLYIDEGRMYWCASGVGFYPVEMWIWCLPGENGQICAEFAISYPPNVIQSTTTKNLPLISVDMGDLASGWSVCYIACQWSWHWPAHQLLYVTDPTKTHCEVVAHPGVGAYQFANCEPGYPVEPCNILSHLFINYDVFDPECAGFATQEASWGAIKSLISE